MFGRWSWQSLLSGLGFSILILASCSNPGAEEQNATGTRVAKSGWLDLSDWRPESEGPIQLSGTWDFYWRELLIPEGGDPKSAPVPITVPRSWHRTQVGPDLKAGRGFGTYRLRVELPTDAPQLALGLGKIETAAEVFVQGQSIWRVGNVAADRDDAVSDYRTGVVLLPKIHGSSIDASPIDAAPIDASPIDEVPVLDLVIEVSSHESARGGLDDPVWLGLAEDLTLARSRALTISGLMSGGFLAMGVYHLCLFAMRRRSRISLYFGLCCLAAVGRLVCSYNLLVLELWPGMPWPLLVKGSYFFTFLTISAFTLYVQALWPSKWLAWLSKVLAGCGGIVATIILVTPPSFSIRSLAFLEIFLAISLLVWGAAFVSALRSQKEGLALYVGSVLFVCLGGLHDAAISLGLLISPFHWGPLGAFFFLLAQSVLLAHRFAHSLTTVEQQRGELQELVDRLGREQRERQRYEELSLAASGLAHETKNPLGIIRGLAQRLTTAPDVNPSTRRRASQILDQADRAASRLGDFLSYARLRDPKFEAVKVGALLRYASEVLAPDLEAKKMPCSIESGDAVVLADEEMLLQIVLNLMLNSIAASDHGGSLDLRFERSPGALERGRLSVTDTGAGIPEDELERVREPYVTGRAGGHGLGLALVERLSKLQGWQLHISSRVGEGTCVEIRGILLAGEGRHETP